MYALRVRKYFETVVVDQTKTGLAGWQKILARITLIVAFSSIRPVMRVCRNDKKGKLLCEGDT